jgi:hypothetical protein
VRRNQGAPGDQGFEPGAPSGFAPGVSAGFAPGAAAGFAPVPYTGEFLRENRNSFVRIFPSLYPSSKTDRPLSPVFW